MIGPCILGDVNYPTVYLGSCGGLNPELCTLGGVISGLCTLGGVNSGL
jgi:hypothetical protein